MFWLSNKKIIFNYGLLSGGLNIALTLCKTVSTLCPLVNCLDLLKTFSNSLYPDQRNKISDRPDLYPKLYNNLIVFM